MHEIKIGTLVNPHNFKKTMPELIKLGFETFSITFWETIGDYNLEQVAKDALEILKGTGCKISSIGVFGNPLMDDARGADARRAGGSSRTRNTTV